MTHKIVRMIGIVVLVALAISISTIILVYNGKKNDKPYSAKLVYSLVDWRDEIGEEEK